MGEVHQKEISTTTDNEEVINLEKVIKVTSIIPCPHTCYFYDGTGVINEDKIKAFLGEHITKLVGWYKFKQILGFKLTLREKLIHKQLSYKSRIASDLFTTCLLTTDRSDNHSTHMYSQTFIRYSDSKYQQLPMQIINLSNPTTSINYAEETSKIINKILSSLNFDIRRSQGLVVTREIHNVLQNYIDHLLTKSAGVEKQVYELEQEIKQYKQNLKWKNECSSDLLKTSYVENGITDNISPEKTPSDSEESAFEIEQKTVSRERTAKRSPSRKVNDSTLTNEIRTRSHAAGKVKNNFSYSQAAQTRKN